MTRRSGESKKNQTRGKEKRGIVVLFLCHDDVHVHNDDGGEDFVCENNKERDFHGVAVIKLVSRNVWREK